MKVFITKFDSNGNQIWGTYYGSTENDIVNSIENNNNKIYITGYTKSSGLATTDGYQNSYIPTYYNSTLLNSGFLAEFNLDGVRNWCTYYNGATIDNIRFSNFDGFYISGYTSSTTGISTPDVIQPALNIGTYTQNSLRNNIFLSKFEYNPLSTTSFVSSNLQLYPNPNNGSFNLKGNYSNSQLNVEINDLNGRLLDKQTIPVFSTELNVTVNVKNKLLSGEYLVNLLDQNKVLQSFKIIVK